jgi:hypothetical protein
MDLSVETAFSGFSVPCVGDISLKVSQMADNVREPGLYSEGKPVDGGLLCEAAGTATAKESLTIREPGVKIAGAKVKQAYMAPAIAEKLAAQAPAPAHERDAVEQYAAEVDRLPQGSEEQFHAFQNVLKALDAKYGK